MGTGWHHPRCQPVCVIWSVLNITSVFHELVIIARTVDLVKVSAEAFDQTAHVDAAVVDELRLLVFVRLVDRRSLVKGDKVIVEPGLEDPA